MTENEFDTIEITKDIKEELNLCGVPIGLEKDIVEDVMSIIDYYENDEGKIGGSPLMCEESVESTLSEWEEYSEYEIDWRGIYHIVYNDVVTDEMRDEWDEYSKLHDIR